MNARTLTAAALVLAASTGLASAEAHVEMPRTSGVATMENLDRGLRAEEIIGADLYTMSAASDDDWMATDNYGEIGDDWEEIGEIEDILISRDGRMIGLVAEVGGWLDIGDERVIVNFDDVRLVGDSMGDYAFVTRLTEEQLEQNPDADSRWWD